MRSWLDDTTLAKNKFRVKHQQRRRRLGDIPLEPGVQGWVPVPGSGQLRRRDVAGRWDPDADDGWIVRLTAAVFEPGSAT